MKNLVNLVLVWLYLFKSTQPLLSGAKTSKNPSKPPFQTLFNIKIEVINPKVSLFSVFNVQKRSKVVQPSTFSVPV